MLTNIRDKIISYIQGNPKTCIALSLLLFVFLAPGLFYLKEDYSYRAWYEESDPLLVRYDEFEKKFGNDDSVVFTVHNPNGLYNKESLLKIYELTEKLWKVDFIVRVESLSNYDFVDIEDDDINIAPLITKDDLKNLNSNFIKNLKNKVTNSEQIKDYLISSDETTAIIRANVMPSFKVMPDNQIITNKARLLIKEFEDENHLIHLSGTAILTQMYNEISNEDLKVLIPTLYLIFTILLILIYKRKSGVLLPYLIISISILMMMGTVAFIGEPINAMSITSPNILLTVALADAIHILTVYFFGLKHGFSNELAVKYSLTKNFYPTLLTSITTAIGFFSFVPAKIHAISVMGMAVGIGVIYAWLMTYFLLGPILVLLKLKPKKLVHQESIEKEAESIFITDKIKKRVQLLVKFKWPIISFTAIISIICLFTLKYLVINMDPFTQFKKDHPLVVANDLINKHLGPAATVEIMINAGEENAAKEPAFLKKVDQFQTWLQSEEYIHKTISIIDILKDLNQKLNNNNTSFYKIADSSETIGQELFFYTLGLPPGKDLTNRISLQNDSIRLTATWDVTSSVRANPLIEKIENKAKEFNLDAVITGKMPLFHDLTPYIVTTFIRSFIIALVAITLILIIVLKSTKLGLLALIPNLFPLIVGASVYAVLGYDVDIASVLIVSVSLGIAVDDSIHFLFEYQKYKALGHDIKENLAIIMTNTFPSLFNTTILIVLGFGSFVFAQYIPNAKFGVMVSFILVIALIADFLILPAILLITEKER